MYSHLSKGFLEQVWLHPKVFNIFFSEKEIELLYSWFGEKEIACYNLDFFTCSIKYGVSLGTRPTNDPLGLPPPPTGKILDFNVDEVDCKFNCFLKTQTGNIN